VRLFERIGIFLDDAIALLLLFLVAVPAALLGGALMVARAIFLAIAKK
jgi:hypothetical protein